LDSLDAEIDEGAHLGLKMFSRRMEGEQRKPLAMPIGKEIDQVALGQE
jgi:hypothetical protein